MEKKHRQLQPALLALMLVLCMVVANAQSPAKFIDPANMDTTVHPGDDFYTYANGTWIKNNPVPAKETRWGSFIQLRDFNINAVKTVLEKAAADKAAPVGSVVKRVGDFYTAGMDSAAIEKRGAAPLQPYMEQIAKIKNKQDLLYGISWLRKMDCLTRSIVFLWGRTGKMWK